MAYLSDLRKIIIRATVGPIASANVHGRCFACQFEVARQAVPEGARLRTKNPNRESHV
jgi:hypothetical protein